MSLRGDEPQSDHASADPLPGAPTDVTAVANRSTVHVEWEGNYDLAFARRL